MLECITIVEEMGKKVDNNSNVKSFRRLHSFMKLNYDSIKDLWYLPEVLKSSDLLKVTASYFFRNKSIKLWSSLYLLTV